MTTHPDYYAIHDAAHNLHCLIYAQMDLQPGPEYADSGHWTDLYAISRLVAVAADLAMAARDRILPDAPIDLMPCAAALLPTLHDFDAPHGHAAHDRDPQTCDDCAAEFAPLW